MGELTQRDSNDEPAQKLLERIRKERNRGKQASPKENKELPGNLPNLPETWVRATIGEIAEIKMGQSPAGSSYNQDKRGVPLINGPTEFGEEHPTPVQWTTEPTKVCNKGDILICVRGNTTGRMNWADQSYCIGRGLAAISANPNLIEIGLLYHYLSKETEELMRRTTGSTFPNLQSNQLRNLSFPLAPYQEQKRLAVKIDECFSLAEKIEDSTKESSNQVEKIDQAILVKAFKGELVPQDPNDEPASILLKRMKGDLAKPGLVAKREKAKTDYQSKLPAEKRQIKSLEEVLREIGPTTIEQTFAASGLGMSEFWDKLRIDIETGRIEKLRRGHLILLRLKN